MATVTWVGSASIDSATAGNWSTGSVPGSGDNVVFGSGSNANLCAWDSGAIGQVSKITIESGFTQTLRFLGGTVVCQSLEVQKAGSIDATSSTNLTFNDAAYDFTNAYVKINSVSDTSLNTATLGMFASTTARNNLVFTMMILGTSSSNGLKFDDGVYPHISLNAGSAAYFFPTYVTPNNTYGKVSMLNLTLAANVSAATTGISIVENDYSKVFQITNIISLTSSILFIITYITIIIKHLLDYKQY